MDAIKSIGQIFTGGGSPSIGIPGIPQIPGLPSSGGSAGAPGWQQLLLGGLFGAGELGNILEEEKQAALQKQVSDYLKYVTGLAKDPAALSRMVVSAEQPLSAALTQNVNNQVQGNMAERGLSQAPGIFAATEAQALAPYVQQNQATAEQQVLSALGLPFSGQATAQSTMQKPQDLSNLLAMFLRSFPTKTPAQTPSTPGITLPTQSDTGLTFPFPTDTGVGVPA